MSSKTHPSTSYGGVNEFDTTKPEAREGNLKVRRSKRRGRRRPRKRRLVRL